jgi:hypothetical protein
MFTAIADFSDLDKTVANLVRALRPRTVNYIAALKAKKQVKKKYAERFKAQTNRGSKWQTAKREAEMMGGGKGFPLGPEPGFLTGTTYRSITAEADNNSGRVFPKGIWPKGSGQISPSRASGQVGYDPNTGTQTFEASSEGDHVDLCFKWSMASGLEYKFWGGGPPKYIEAQPMVNIRYGGVREIQWNFLNEDDVSSVRAVVDEMIRHNITGNISALKALYKRTIKDPKLHIRGEVIEAEAPVAVIAAGAESFKEVELNEMSQLINGQIADIRESMKGGRMTSWKQNYSGPSSINGVKDERRTSTGRISRAIKKRLRYLY